jgi:outer membrane protein OmpA-like peptidoglycan-associated protein
MYSQTMKCFGRALALASLVAMPIALTAQDTPDAPKPAPKAQTSGTNPSKWDIFLGYSYLAPHGNVNGQTFNAINYAAIASVSRYFNNYVGVTLEGDEHLLTPENGNVTTTQPNNDFSGGSAGLIFRYPTSDITPFVHALVGGERVGSYALPETWGVVLTAGGGMDYETPLFNHHLAIRIFQADYQYTHEDFDPGVRGNFNNARLSAGLVYHIGTIAPPPPPTIACSANPTSVFPGEPVTVTATASGLNPKQNAIYTWSGDGVSGNGTTATVATANLAPGTYTVKCGVKEGKPGKEGLKPWENADASTTFTVKEFEPPTISCSASPSTIKPGDSATITATGVSPQNRPLTYSYSAASGQVSGTGTTATYNSTGAPTGSVDITCNVADDKGHSASSTTTVTIVAPPPPPQPHAQALCSISFETDKARPTRVDNEAKACLDQVALDLQQQADAKAVLVGHADDKEKAKTAKEQKFAEHHKHAKVEDFAAQRAVNAKDYLVTEKGIDASRVTAATSNDDGKKVEDYLVPAGADFNADVQGTTPVDESTVKPQARKALPERHHHAAASQQ